MLRLTTLLVLAIALAAVYFRQGDAAVPTNYITGRNNTALFLVAEHHGLSNVHLATAQSLLEHYPEIEVQFASFPKLARKFPRLSALAQKKQPAAKDIVFHRLTGGQCYVDAVTSGSWGGYDEDGLSNVISAPGLPGIKKLAVDIQHVISPWPKEEHLALHNEIAALIDEIDPAVVVLDTIFGPAIEATRGRNRTHAFITPNTLIDNFVAEQPYGQMFWKYPAMGSGFPYPVPWHLIPMNMYLNARLIYNAVNMPNLAAKKAFLAENGVLEPIRFLGLHRPNVPWLTQTTPGASVPVSVVPENVTCTGPITLSPAPAEEQDPELVDWIKQKSTVLINLGSAFTYSIGQTKQVIGAIEEVLKQSDLQVLWKYDLSPGVTFDWEAAVKPLIQTGRVRVSQWLKIDPPSLLQSGHITAFVTHGGANGYHESIEAGVPQIVLPMWVDLFNFAQLAEQIGVGVWGCRETSPHWASDCLSEAILKVAGSSAMKEKAAQLSAQSRERPGRDVAAEVIAKLAMSGN